MQALTLIRPGEIVCQQVEAPRLESPTDVIVEVEIAGLCGSDLHPYFGREQGLDPGTVVGHEFVGRVVDKGSDVHRLQIGDRVVAPFSTSCGECALCRSGLTARCDQGQLFGWVERGIGLQGAQAELVRVPLADSTLLEVPDDVGSEAALLCGDILSTGLFSADLGTVGASRSVVVLGCGPVGLMCIVAARARGAEQVLAVDTVPERLGLAERLGATAVDPKAEPTVARALEATGGLGAHAVIEAIGSPEAMRLAIDLVRPGGTIAAPGVHTEEQFAFSPGEAYDKNLTYRAGRCPARAYMDEAMEVVRARGDLLTSVITHRFPLTDGPNAYRIFSARLEGCVKAIFFPAGMPDDEEPA
jgi:2-desacetyl-2-hydroxyethyl bacteriochlorophyllide A dehydrogenase